jgi:hypothetical protein
MKKRTSETSDRSAGREAIGGHTETIDLVTLLAEVDDGCLQRVRINENEVPIIPFTSEGVRCEVHYCDEADIRDYVLCNGADCILCRVGKKKDQRVLLPVYRPVNQSIAVLPVSPSLRPLALLPQIAAVLKSKRPMVLFIARRGSQFRVSSCELKDNMDSGSEAIKRFKEEYEAGTVDLTSVLSRIPNEQLKLVSEIAQILQYRETDTSDSD